MSQTLIHEYSTIQQAIQRLKTNREELLQIYTEKHPLVIARNRKEAELNRQLEAIKEKMRRLPLENQEEIDLQREVRIRNTVYLSLLNNEQQLEVIKAGLVSDLVVLSDATPATRLSSHKILITLLGFLMGAFITSILVIIRSTFSKTIESSEHLENEVRVPVQSVIPYSRTQRQLEKISEKEFEN